MGVSEPKIDFPASTDFIWRITQLQMRQIVATQIILDGRANKQLLFEVHNLEATDVCWESILRTIN